MKLFRRKFTALILSLCTVFAMCAVVLPASVQADNIIRSTVNIAIANKNERGAGYDWANRTDVLTLNNLHIDTTDPYGLRLPDNCTVILKGDNYVKASKYGLACSGTVVFKGSGSLTIEAGDVGIYLVSQDSTHKIRLIEGTYTVKAGTYGVYSEYADFSFVGDKMNIEVTGENSSAILGRRVNLMGGTFTANSSVESTHELAVEGVNLDITSNRAVFDAKILTIKDVDMTSNGTAVAEYNGETSITGKSTAKHVRTSAVFGENVPGFVDYICLVILAVGVAAGIFGPALHHKKKKKELYERLAREGYDVPKD